MKAKLKDALKEAMKAKDRVKMDTIRSLLSAIQYEEIQKGSEDLPSETLMAIAKNEIKKRKEAIELAIKGNRLESKPQLENELSILEAFLPTQLSESDLEKILTKYRSDNPQSNMGQAMKALKDQYFGQYDGKCASDLAKRLFS